MKTPRTCAIVVGAMCTAALAAVLLGTGNDEGGPNNGGQQGGVAYEWLVAECEYHTSEICSLALFSDGRHAAVVPAQDLDENGPRGSNGRVDVFDMVSHSRVRRLTGGSRYISGMAVSADDRFIATAGDDGAVCLWGENERVPFRVFRGHDSPVHRVLFLENPTQCVSSGSDGTVRIWDIESNREVRRFGPKPRMLNSLAVSRDGDVVFAAGPIGVVWGWAIESGELVHEIRIGEAIRSIAVSSDGTRLIVSSPHEPHRIVDIASGDVLHSFGEELRYEMLGSNIAFGVSTYATTNGREVELWSIDGAPRLLARGSQTGVRVLLISPDGRVLFTGGGDGCGVIRWKIDKFGARQ